MKGANEPSHALCDLAAATYQKDQLSRIEWKEQSKALKQRPFNKAFENQGL